MSAYRFCRSDDIQLLVDALNRCWAPYFPDEPLATPATFKRTIRNLQVWCSSCMVAFSGADPIGVLIGAKRTSGTLIQKIAVHPEHRRQGHGRHLLTSLGSKLAILGPPRIVAEVPETLTDASSLFSACGYVEEAVLTDYVLLRDQAAGAGGQEHPRSLGTGYERGLVIPISVDDLAANSLLEADHLRTCWERAVETLTARKDDIAGLAVASDERIEAYILYIGDEIVGLRSFVEDDGARLMQLLGQLQANGLETLRLAKVHPAEFSWGQLEALGFRPAGGHRLYATLARSQ
jgi:ribosomal protein S18 acetylase RimI-like enzyme